MLKCALGLCFSLHTSCSPPNDIVSFFGPRLKKFADPYNTYIIPIIHNIIPIIQYVPVI